MGKERRGQRHPGGDPLRVNQGARIRESGERLPKATVGIGGRWVTPDDVGRTEAEL